MPRTRPRLRRALATVASALAAAAVAAPGASAHATLLSSEPANDAVLPRPPAQVVLRFDEPIETAFGSVRVFDGDAERVDDGVTRRPAREQAAVGLEPDLPRGTYTVAWRVVSGDGHPVHGAFVFHVGAPGRNPQGVAAQVLGAGTDGGVDVARDVVRALDYALLLLAAGGAAALALLLRSGRQRARDAVRAFVAACATLLVPAALLAIVLQGAAAAGVSFGDAFDGGVLSAVLDTRFGRVWFGQAAGATALVLATALSRRVRAAGLAAAVLAGWLVVTPAASGHAQATGTLAFALDALHVAAAAVWVGGLAAVAVGLLASRGERWAVARELVPRFSAVALAAVVALVAAGAVQGYLQVRAWRGLWETDYGILLLVKVGLVLPILALGAYNRRFAVPGLRDQLASAAARARFVRAVGGELALAAGVVAVTAVLVAEPPARAAVAPTGPIAAAAPLGPWELDYVVDPARAGANSIHLYLLDRNGQPARVDGLTLEASLPSERVGPLRLQLFPAGPAHYTVPAAHLAIPGDWQLVVTARRGDFEQHRTSVSLPIRKG